MADFTSWTAMVAALKNNLSNRDLAVAEHRTPDGTIVRYRSIAELKDLLATAESRAAAETATAGTPTRRSHARPTSDLW